MTGQDLTDGIIFFFIGAIAVCIPAVIATLIRKYFVEPDPAPNVAANILLPSLIYIAGFFVSWGIMIFAKWDGAQRIEHLIISPVSYVIFPAAYAALVGAATALFSIPLPRGVKLAQHHITICWISQCVMAILMFYAYLDYRDHVSRTDAPIQQPQSYVEYQPQRDAPLGTSQNQINIQFDKMIDQAEQRYSPLNPSSPNYSQHLVDEIEAKVRLYESQGSPAPIALRRAVKEVTNVEIFILPAQ